MFTLATDHNNDLFLTEAGNIAFKRDILAVMQDCETAVKAQRGEMLFAADQGIPTREVVWNNTNIPKFRAAVISAILAVDGVQDITEFEAEVTGDVLRYRAVIKTIYGIGSINGGL